MKECLACWEEIEDTEEICPHCGSKQDEVRDYLALVLLKQGKRKISVPEETPVLDYIFETDPAIKEEIKLGASAITKDTKTTPQPQAGSFGIQSNGTYKPTQPSWLSRPETVKQEVQEKPSPEQDDKPAPKIRTVQCPNCKNEVKLLEHCKFCGQQLLRKCPACNSNIRTTAKFCKTCGNKVNPLIERKKS